jgi:hypothetical protein
MVLLSMCFVSLEDPSAAMRGGFSRRKTGLITMISPIERSVIKAQPNRDADAVKQFREIGLAHCLTGDMAPVASFPS